jgi:tRNA nucleotidyltransferase/poly(A) polymerase
VDIDMDKIKQIAEQFAIRGIQTYYVGGMVRDKHLGIPNDDINLFYAA